MLKIRSKNRLIYKTKAFVCAYNTFNECQYKLFCKCIKGDDGKYGDYEKKRHNVYLISNVNYVRLFDMNDYLQLNVSNFS